MFTSGLTNTPITKTLLIYILVSSILLSILDIKHLAGIQVSPHFWTYGQFWRAALWHVAGFANSTEALFAGILVYQVRVVERAWGGRKVASFLVSTLPYTTLLPPILLALFIRPISLTTINYLPSGPTAAIFALLAQYHALIPHTFRYRLATTSSPSSENDDDANANNASTRKPALHIPLTSKSPIYLIASQLALSQFPYMLLPAVTGWMVGLAWRAELLPGGVSWRVPAWMVGEKDRPRYGSRYGSGSADDGNERYEDLRRRLEGEVAAAGRSSGQSQGGVDAQRRRV